MSWFSTTSRRSTSTPGPWWVSRLSCAGAIPPGIAPPGEFIPLAEDSGLIVPLGAWVVGEACRQTAAWHLVRTEAGQDDGRLNISVNVSAQQIADPSFPGQVAAALDESGLNPDKLWLEITESTLMGNGDLVIATLTSLRDLGLHLEIDDFGTGTPP